MAEELGEMIVAHEEPETSAGLDGLSPATVWLGGAGDDAGLGRDLEVPVAPATDVARAVPRAAHRQVNRSNSARGLRAADFRVLPEHRPGWTLASERTPVVGETVYCAGGEGVVVSLHGKTGDGSRLLQIKFEDPKTAPFFAAASNVLVRP